MKRERRDEQWAPGRHVHMGNGSVYSEGVKADNINIDGSLDASINASATSRSSSESTIVVAEQLRERVDELCSVLAVQGFTGERGLEEAVELRAEVAGPTAVRRRIDELLAAIERRAGQLTAVATAIDVTRQVLGR